MARKISSYIYVLALFNFLAFFRGWGSSFHEGDYRMSGRNYRKAVIVGKDDLEHKFGPDFKGEQKHLGLNFWPIYETNSRERTL